MSSYGHPAGTSPAKPTPALDFCVKVNAWQEAEGGTAGIRVPLPAGEDITLNQLLATLRASGPSETLEQQARYWLIGYREAEQLSPVLTAGQRAELSQVTAGIPHSTDAARRLAGLRQLLRLNRVALTVLAVVVLLLCTAIWRVTHPAGTSPAAAAPPAAGLQQVAPGSTPLQDFEHDWGPWTQLPASQQDPQTGAPALLLLDQGRYLVSGWVIPACVTWNQDLSGDIAATEMHGSYALITDADGNLYVVGTGQPFVLSRDPGTILKVDPAGSTWSITTAHAAAVHRPLRKGTACR